MFNYELWRIRHNECVFKVKRFCELSKKMDYIKCNSALCVMNNAMQDIHLYFESNVSSSAEFCFLIRNIDVIITGLLDLNNSLLGVGLNKTDKAIEKCFTEKNIINKFRTLRSLVIAHPVDTHYVNDNGESEIVYLEDIRPYNSSVDAFIMNEKCDYVKRMYNPLSEKTYFDGIVVDKDIVPVIVTIIDSIYMLTNKIEDEIIRIESGLCNDELIIDKKSIKDYIESLSSELEKRYPAVIEKYEYEDGSSDKYSIVDECMIFFDANYCEKTMIKYRKLLDYLEKELNKIEIDLQKMTFNEDKYFTLLYNNAFAPNMSYEKGKMMYLRDSVEKSYTDEYIDSNTNSDVLWGIRCFRKLLPFIEEYIPVDLKVSDRELYCQFVAGVYLSNFS